MAKNTLNQIERGVKIKELKDRMISFDASEVISRLSIKPNQRHQSIPIHVAFPDLKNGLCGCGCNRELPKNRKRWFDDWCNKFGIDVCFIIAGYTDVIYRYLCHSKGAKCSCGESGSDVDHIVPVKHGGAGRWLDNYQLLCKSCHVKKTAKDFNYKTALEVTKTV